MNISSQYVWEAPPSTENTAQERQSSLCDEAQCDEAQALCRERIAARQRNSDLAIVQSLSRIRGLETALRDSSEKAGLAAAEHRQMLDRQRAHYEQALESERAAKARLETQRLTSEHLASRLAEAAEAAQRRVSDLEASLSWRLTAFPRRIVGLGQSWFGFKWSAKDSRS